jgi:hypothetical protein
MSDVTAVGGATPPATPTTTKTTSDKTSAKDFKETLKKVSGHKYAQIADGDRKGQYVNQSGNARNGEAFKLVERDGFEFHVYGSRVVRLPKAS